MRVRKWQDITLGQLVSLQRGHDLPSDRREAGCVPVMGSFGVTGHHSVARAKGPGVIVGRSGASAGVVSFTEADYWPLNTCLFSTNFHGNNPKFVFYLLSTLNLGSYNSGSAQPSLNRNYIAPIPISVPLRAEQDEIANLLSALDDKIVLNGQISETLAAMAQAIFRDWFIDFGPVRRKLAGETDPVAIMGGLTPDLARATELAALFPRTLTDDGLPEGWFDLALSAHLDIIGGGTPKTSVETYWGGTIPWFSVVDTPIGSNTFVFATEKTVTEAGLAGSSARMVPAGTTIISARGTVGNLAVAAQDMTFNQSCYALRSARGDYPYFVYLTAAHAVERLRAMAHGSVFSTITRQTFDSLTFPQAPLPLMGAFEATVEPLFSRLRASVAESRTLAETRDYLLPRLMSGAVRVEVSR